MSSRLPRRPRAAPVLAMAALSLLAAAAAPGAAQTTPTEEAVSTFVRPGEIVRVRVRGGAAWEGDFAGARDGRLLLAGGGDTLALATAEVEGLWVRERRTRGGVRTGALVGAGVGLVASGLTAGLIAKIGGAGDAEVAGLLLGGAVLGAAGGGGVGAAVGSAGTRWRQVVPADPGIRPGVPLLAASVGRAGAAPSLAGTSATVPTRRRFGSLDGAVAYGRLGSADGSEGGVGGRLAVLAELRRGDGATRTLVAYGPEVEVQGVGSAGRTRLVFPDCTGQAGCPPPVEETLRQSYRAAAVRGLVRVGPESDRWRAYGLLGAGVHGWRTPTRDDEGREYGGSWYTHPSGVAGAGVQLRPRAGPLSVGVEGRMNRVLLSGDTDPGRYWTAALTLNTSL